MIKVLLLEGPAELVPKCRDIIGDWVKAVYKSSHVLSPSFDLQSFHTGQCVSDLLHSLNRFLNRTVKAISNPINLNSLRFDQILKIFKGETFTPKTEQRRFKSLNKLNITPSYIGSVGYKKDDEVVFVLGYHS